MTLLWGCALPLMALRGKGSKSLDRSIRSRLHKHPGGLETARAVVTARSWRQPGNSFRNPASGTVLEEKIVAYHVISIGFYGEVSFVWQAQ